MNLSKLFLRAVVIPLAIAFIATILPQTALAASFRDVHAGDEGNHASDVLWLADRGISTGFPDGTFRGGQAVKRADLAAFLYRMAGSPDYTPSASVKAMIRDVNDSTPHAKEIYWLASMGITRGWEVSAVRFDFRPLSSVTRQDMAAFLHRLATRTNTRLSGNLSTSFRDVSANDAGNHGADVIWMASNGIAKGWSDQTFRGRQDLTRQDAAAFLHRLSIAGLSGMTANQSNAQAVAQTSYLNWYPISYQSLIEQLKAAGYSEGDATYAADGCGADWQANATQRARDYLNTGSFTHDTLVNQLTNADLFTADQAQTAANSVGL